MNQARFGIVLVLIVCSYFLGLLTYRYNLPPLSLYRNPVSKERARRVYEKSSPEFFLKGRELLESLRGGGHILFFRHGNHGSRIPPTSDPLRMGMDTMMAMTTAKINHPTFRKGVCLSERGMAEAWVMSQVFRELKIPVGKVVASPLCAARETAEQTFGRIDEVNRSLVYERLMLQEERDLLLTERAALFQKKPVEGANTIIVGHASTLQEMGRRICSGPCTTIFKIDESNHPQLVAQLGLLEWTQLLEREPLS